MSPQSPFEQRAEDFFSFFDTVAAAMSVTLIDGTMVKVNKAYCDFLGYSEEELLQLKVLDFTHPEDRELTEARFREAREGKKAAHYEKRYLRKDGSTVWGLVSTSWVREGPAHYCLGLVQDITARKEMEQSLRESEELYRSLVENIDLGINLIGEDHRILKVNRATSRIIHKPAEELVGRKCFRVFEGREKVCDHCPGVQSLVTGKPAAVITEGVREDGTRAVVRLQTFPVPDADGSRRKFVEVAEDITERVEVRDALRESEEQLRYLAEYDALTGLPKRQVLESVLQHALERARREKKRLALLVLDLDQFKSINESFSHETGDELLVSVAQRLQKRVRREDSLSRLVGDGFALVLDGIEDFADVELVAHDLNASLQAPFILPDGHQVYLRASVGISVFPQDGDTAQDLLRGADAAVNLAKERGGNQFCYCTAELNTQARVRLELQSELGRALEREEFLLHYQPKADLGSGRIVGAEALLRWRHPEKGLIPPVDFIPIAEKTGLIVPLGTWVIDRVCRQIRAWCDAGLPAASVAVNVSAAQFRSGNLQKLVSAALERHGVEPRSLMIELTESMLVDDPEEAIARMAALRRIGVRISLDDFGTGYSSLGYLARFPIDQVKIDRSFIAPVVTDPNAAMIATSVIALAHRLRLRVVAEGVETEAQLGYLRQNGCDEMQGFYFSRPVPPEEFAAMLRKGAVLPLAQQEAARPTLLIVDDEPNILDSLRRMLDNEGYRVLTAGSGAEGLDLLAKNTVQVIVTDQRMPQMSGTEFLRRVKMLHPHSVRMILSGFADLQTVTASVNESALYKFLVKPWDDDTLRAQIREAFDFYETMYAAREGQTITRLPSMRGA